MNIDDEIFNYGDGHAHTPVDGTPIHQFGKDNCPHLYALDGRISKAREPLKNGDVLFCRNEACKSPIEYYAENYRFAGKANYKVVGPQGIQMVILNMYRRAAE